MKKLVTYMCLVAVAMSAACSKADMETPSVQPTAGEASIQVAPVSADTRVSISDAGELFEIDWEVGDKLGVYNMSGKAEVNLNNRLHTFTCSEVDDQGVATFKAGNMEALAAAGLAANSGKTLHFRYEPNGETKTSAWVNVGPYLLFASDEQPVYKNNTVSQGQIESINYFDYSVFPGSHPTVTSMTQTGNSTAHLKQNFLVHSVQRYAGYKAVGASAVSETIAIPGDYGVWNAPQNLDDANLTNDDPNLNLPAGGAAMQFGIYSSIFVVDATVAAESGAAISKAELSITQAEEDVDADPTQTAKYTVNLESYTGGKIYFIVPNIPVGASINVVLSDNKGNTYSTSPFTAEKALTPGNAATKAFSFSVDAGSGVQIPVEQISAAPQFEEVRYLNTSGKIISNTRGTKTSVVISLSEGKFSTAAVNASDFSVTFTDTKGTNYTVTPQSAKFSEDGMSIILETGSIIYDEPTTNSVVLSTKVETGTLLYSSDKNVQVVYSGTSVKNENGDALAKSTYNVAMPAVNENFLAAYNSYAGNASTMWGMAQANTAPESETTSASSDTYAVSFVKDPAGSGQDVLKVEVYGLNVKADVIPQALRLASLDKSLDLPAGMFTTSYDIYCETAATDAPYQIMSGVNLGTSSGFGFRISDAAATADFKNSVFYNDGKEGVSFSWTNMMYNQSDASKNNYGGMNDKWKTVNDMSVVNPGFIISDGAEAQRPIVDFNGMKGTYYIKNLVLTNNVERK